MQLFWEEAKKPFKSKRTLLIMLAILLIQVGSVMPDYFDFKKKCGSVEAYNEYANAYNNQISEKYVKQEDITRMLKDSYIGRETSKETIFYNQYPSRLTISMPAAPCLCSRPCVRKQIFQEK